MKLLGNTESKITKDKNAENVPHIEVIAILLIMIINQIKEYYIHLFQTNHLVVYLKFHQQTVYF